MTSSLWKHKNFLKLWIAQGFSLFGSQVTAVALPLTLVGFLKASPIEIGLMAAATHLPFLLFGLPAGAWVDRFSRRGVMLICDGARFFLILLIPLLSRFEALTYTPIFLIAFLCGIFNLLFDIAHQTYLPQVVEPRHILDGNTKLYAAFAASQLVGPLLAGLLIEVFNAPYALVFDAISFALSFLFLLSIQETAAVQQKDQNGTRRERRIKDEILAGLEFSFGNPYLRAIVVSTSIANLFGLFGMAQALLPHFALKLMELSTAQYGLALALANCGALAGTFANEKLLRLVGIGPVFVLSCFLEASAFLVIPFIATAHSIFGMAIPLAIGQFGISLFNVNQLSLRQAVTPAHLLGRVNATVRFVMWGTIPIGTILGGFVGERLGLRAGVFIAGVGCLLSGAPIFFSSLPKLKKLDRGQK